MADPVPVICITGIYAGNEEYMKPERIKNELCSTGLVVNVNCDRDQVIVMIRAVYGFFQGACTKGLSVPEDQHCQNNVLKKCHVLCSGKRSCEMQANSFYTGHSCVDVAQNLNTLLFDYECWNVSTTTKFANCKISNVEGFLANIESKCGSNDNPWIIKMYEGQTITITLHDFSARNDSSLDYGTITELSHSYQIRPDLGGNIKPIYTSHTNSVHITLNKDIASHFLLEFKARGCKTPDKPAYGSHERMGDYLIITCDDGNKRWRLLCVNNEWQGTNENCTENVESTTKNSANIPLIIVALLIILMFLFAVATFALYRSRMWKNAVQSPQPIYIYHNVPLAGDASQAGPPRTYEDIGQMMGTYGVPVINASDTEDVAIMASKGRTATEDGNSPCLNSRPLPSVPKDILKPE